MRIIYFDSIPGREQLAAKNTDKSVDELKKAGFIEKDSVVLIININTDLNTMTDKDEEQAALLYHLDYCKFDSYTKPSKLVPDLERLQLDMLDDLRTQREEQFKVLDAVTIRAMGSGRDDLLPEIEADKQALRDITKKLRISNPTRIGQFYNRDYGALRVDFDAKYRSLFKK